MEKDRIGVSDILREMREYAEKRYLGPRSRVVVWADAISEIEHCRKDAERMQKEIEMLQELYNELLYQVEQKHPDETRHETAKRLIQQAQLHIHVEAASEDK